jgi:hypothetical protein
MRVQTLVLGLMIAMTVAVPLEKQQSLEARASLLALYSR